jgi:hypothetical protein
LEADELIFTNELGFELPGPTLARQNEYWYDSFYLIGVRSLVSIDDSCLVSSHVNVQNAYINQESNVLLKIVNAVAMKITMQ